MQIVIDIPEKLTYEGFERPFTEEEKNILIKAIGNGTPLPKGHGKLVDISKIDEDRIESDNPIIYLTINGQYTEAIGLDYLNNLPPIIEANKEESED